MNLMPLLPRAFSGAIFTLSLLPTEIQAESLTSTTAQELYAKALTKERGSLALSYQTTRQIGDKTTTEKHYVLKGDSGGGFLRIERTSVTPRTTYLVTDISNDGGYWTIIDDYAIRIPNKNNEAITTVAAFRDELRLRKVEGAPPDKFSGETVVRGERSFVVINREVSPVRFRQEVELTQRVAGGAETTNSALPETQANYRRGRELRIIKQKLPARFQYVIDAEQQLIVEERSFNIEGGLLRQTIRQNLRIENNLPEDFFKVPVNCKKHFPTSFSVYTSLVKEATLAQGAAWRSKNKPKKEQKKQ